MTAIISTDFALNFLIALLIPHLTFKISEILMIDLANSCDLV